MRCGATGLAAANLFRRRVLLLFLSLAVCAPASAADLGNGLVDLSFEELASIQITSVSRRAERLDEAAASVYVITAEAIRRAGATSLPQAMRLAPNLQVAQIDAGQFAITARGFNNAIGNKLLVLIDGRTAYTPFFSGVFWDQQDVVLDDVERIEVISGPGATLWGANAVNGVINVITRPARATPGLLLGFDAGPRETSATLRFGGSLPAGGHARAYVRQVRRDDTRSESGAAAADASLRRQIGFRADWAFGIHSLTLQGDAYDGSGQTRQFGSLAFAPVRVAGHNLLGRWERSGPDGNGLRVQAYVDRSSRDDRVLYGPVVDIVDIEVQQTLQRAGHQWVWGGGTRRSRDDIAPGFFFGFHPAQRTLRWSNVFVQDEFSLAADLALTLGLKLEHNGYTGNEKLPSARLAWQLAPGQLLWAALSRAVRAPARLDRDISLPPNPPYLIAGGPQFVSEVAKVVEIGWRAQPTASFTISATAFHHRWDRLRSGQPAPDAQVLNQIDGSTQGLEAWAVWQALPGLRISAGGTLLRMQLALKPGSTDPTGPRALGNDPKWQQQLRAAMNPAPGHEFDIALRRVAALPDPALPGYTALDLRYGWRVAADCSLSLVGQNLLDPGHAEFGSAPGRSELPRSALLQLRWTR